MGSYKIKINLVNAGAPKAHPAIPGSEYNVMGTIYMNNPDTGFKFLIEIDGVVTALALTRTPSSGITVNLTLIKIIPDILMITGLESH